MYFSKLTTFYLSEFQDRTIFLLTEIRSLLRRVVETEAKPSAGDEAFTEFKVAFQKANTIEDLEVVEERLKDQNYKKNLVCYSVRVFSISI